MNSAYGHIPVRSHRQAMDWSLVLASQGIETIIQQTENDDGWELLVPPSDYGTAIQVLRQYVKENRGWPWRQSLPMPGFLFDWGSLVWALVIILFHWFSVTQMPQLREAGMMDSTAVRAGEWWRLFTAVWLHADIPHLVSNATFGILLLGLAMGHYGAGQALLAAFLAGAGGNLLGFFFYPEPHRGLGASGMVMGALGLLAVQSYSVLRESPQPLKYVLTGIIGGIMLFVFLGLSPGTDLVAHFGGFVGGMAVGSVLGLLPAGAHGSSKFNFAAGTALALLVIGSWYLAMLRGA